MKTYRLACAPNEDSHEPVHPRNLIRVFIVRMKKLCIRGYQKCAQKIPIGLRECSEHMSDGTFSHGVG